MQKIVIKIGTNLLTQKTGELNLKFIEKIAREIQRLHTNKKEVLLVTSGAVAAGRGEIKREINTEETIAERQALAAIGQSRLMQNYYQIFTLNYKVTIAQVLLTANDFENLDALQNMHNVIKSLLMKKVLPIINENDVTAIDELKYMANDRLAARVTNLVGADALILLTDVAGFFDDNPHENPKAKLLKELTKNNLPKINTGANTGGHGGMQTKFEAAKIAECPVWIAAGKDRNVLSEIVLQGENPGTVII
jgi:glutamate 5-kinase